MGAESGAMGEEKVQFLASVIASISHELKNALATVHETAGLLSDILKTSPDPAAESDEIRRCAETVSEELDRAFEVVRNLNAFAHSADDAWKELDPAEVAGLTATLVGYLSYAGRARIEAREGRPVRLVTSPVLLEDLVYRILKEAYRAGGREAEVSLSVRESGDGAEIHVTGPGRGGELLREEARPILEALSAEAVTDPKGGGLRILLPAVAGGSTGG